MSDDAGIYVDAAAKLYQDNARPFEANGRRVDAEINMQEQLRDLMAREAAEGGVVDAPVVVVDGFAPTIEPQVPSLAALEDEKLKAAILGGESAPVEGEGAPVEGEPVEPVEPVEGE